MEKRPDQLRIIPLYSRPEDLNPPVSSYVITGGPRVVVVDPGPSWHLQMHLTDIEQAASATTPVVAVIQSPGPGMFGGLELLRQIGANHTVVMHWKTSLIAGEDIDGWRVQSLTTKSVGLPLSATRKLAIGVSPYGGAPGSLMSFERGTGTLFSGPFFGSLGTGQESGKPVLRRESVRAFHDVMNPSMPHDILDRVFGTSIAINQIAPTYGRMATGGSSLIEAVFRDDEAKTPLASALLRLFVRAAALIGPEAAGGIFRATGIPIPDIESGIPVMSDAEVSNLTDEHWTRVVAALEQWLSGTALTGLFPVVGEMARKHGLPLDKSAERYSRAARPDWREKDSLEAGSGVTQRRAFGTADMPGTVASGSDGADAGGGSSDLTDRATGLMNETVYRRRTAGQFGSELTPEGSGSVILMGVDNIQRINATFGRSGGDDALYTVAYLLRNFQAAHSRRGAHRVYKLSGPLFAYVLSQGSVAEGADVAERIRRVISESAMFLEQLTVSVGVVGLDEVLESAREGEGGEALTDTVTSRALARLKIAQAGGANTVCSSDPAGMTRIAGGSTVLIADPDAPYLEMLTAILEGQGYTVLLARDGGEAGDIITQIVPDAIVAEVMLPKLNGFTLREELRHDARLSQIPFILVSHKKTEEAMEKAAMLGIVHFLAKPFSLVELTGLLRNLTQNSGPEDFS